MDKKELILAYEIKFAQLLANQVLVKPKLSPWMIFIPFIFIFYFQDFSAYKKQRKEFLANWLLTRKKVLNEVKKSIDKGRKPDTWQLAAQVGLKAAAMDKYDELLKVMVTHYTLLLKAKGDTYGALVKSAYGNRRQDFIFLINRMTEAEKNLNRALVPTLCKTVKDLASTIKKIERGSDKVHRLEINKFFPSVK
ncbi:MAG: hypothetical protein GY710_19705 [Desulfobacteraceae bacterium]|nr:hypothetical protein [Desulfobacteraceae bacterium]